MKIRIIKNAPPTNASDINQYIGKVLNVLRDSSDRLIVCDNCDIRGAIIFEGEYEIVEDDAKDEEIHVINGISYLHRELVEIIEKANIYDEMYKSRNSESLME